LKFAEHAGLTHFESNFDLVYEFELLWLRGPTLAALVSAAQRAQKFHTAGKISAP
jgi:hypothetical protein